MKSFRGQLAAALTLISIFGVRSSFAVDFAGFINPVSNPTNFEDPRIESDIRPIFAYHNIDDNFLNDVEVAGLKAPKGDAKVVAMQIRLKLADRLALIATKDGYVWVNPENDVLGVVKESSGFANLAAGLKYNFFRDEDLGALFSGGIRYEAPSGEPQGLQGGVFRRTALSALGAATYDAIHEHGNGLINLFLSGGWGCGDFHVLGYTGPRLALDSIDSSFYDTSLHADYRIAEMFYPLVEINWTHVLEGGNRLKPVEKALGRHLDEEGFDFFNLGAPSSGGTDVATIAFGGRVRLADKLDVFGHTGGVDFGSVAEFPMTSRHDLFGWRVTTDIVFWVL